MNSELLSFLIDAGAQVIYDYGCRSLGKQERRRAMNWGRTMANREVQVARRYHKATKHSPWGVRISRHRLDWANKPAPFKIYPDLDPIPLPSDLPATGMPALEAVGVPRVEAEGEAIPDLAQLAHVLYYSAGVTKKLIHPNGNFYFRAASCAGALYPIETYVVCGDLPDLEAGVYHFNPGDFALRRLRAGDYRGALVQASGGEPAVAGAPALLVCTAITWRSAWKYEARSYRYHFWDNGTILANTLAATVAQRLPAEVVMSFVDDEVNQLLGIDGKDEKSLCLVPLGSTSAPAPDVEDVPALDLAVAPLSDKQDEYPIIDEMHAASALRDPDEVAEWRQASPNLALQEPRDESFALQPVDEADLPENPSEDVIVRRGSSRRFRREAITFAELSTLLERATRGVPTDWLDLRQGLLNDLYLNVHAVDGLPAGAYVFRPQDQALEQLEAGDFRERSAHLCLWQDLGGESSVTVFFLADLDSILKTYGNRGYRAVQMEAGIVGGKLYLGAYALDLGATGLTFFDDDVVDFFSPHAAGKDAIFVTALGVPAPPEGQAGRLVKVEPGERVLDFGR